MNFFMPSKQISVFEKKFKKMIDKLENKPTYTISEPMKKLYKFMHLSSAQSFGY